MIRTLRNKYLLKKLIYSHIPKKNWDDINLILFVSTGRTGTKFFSSYFRKHTKNVLAKHEPYPNFNIQGSEFFKGNYEKEEILKNFLNSRSIIQKQLYQKNLNNYLESNGGLTFLLPVLKNLTDNYKIVHVIRNPKTWVRSACNRHMDKNGQIIPPRDNVLWKIKSDDFPNDPFYGKWNEMSFIDKHAWIWNKKNSFLINQVTSDNRAITIKFEDVFQANKNYSGFDTVINFLSKDINLNFTINDPKSPIKEKVNQTNQYEFPPYEEWSEDQKNRFLEITGNLIKKMDYF